MKYDEIMEAVQHHHYLVQEKDYNVIMTVLIGSQNYNLADKNSDIDTFSLLFPTLEQLSIGAPAAAGEFQTEDGKCIFKDIRTALNLLKKASPNSIELFLSDYIYINPKYKLIVEKYLEKEKLKYMVHCNYSHMIYACAGMAHQLTKRNMPAGKRYAHAARLYEMVDKYLFSLDISKLLKVDMYSKPPVLITAKRDTNEKHDNHYNMMCDSYKKEIERLNDEYYWPKDYKEIEQYGLNLIHNFQLELTKKCLQECLNEL